MENHRTKILGFALLLAGLTLYAVGLRLLLGPAQYQATVKIRIEPDTIADTGPFVPTRGSSWYDPYFIQTEFEVIQSQIVLSRVVEALNLNVEWGKRYAGVRQLKTIEVVNLLKRRIDLRLVRNTRLIEISMTSADPDEAAKIANAIAGAYREFRLNQRRQLTIQGIQVLTEDYQNEEEEIRVLQTNVDLLRAKYKINKQDEADFDNPSIISPNSKLITSTEREERKKEYEMTKPFWDEKRRLAGTTEFHKLLKEKIESSKLGSSLVAPPSMVQIIDPAVPPQSPVGPDRVFGALLCAIGLFPSGAGFLLLKSSRRPSD